MWATVRRVLHISKVVLIGPSQLEVQGAELIRVFFFSCWVGPWQNTEVVSVKQLSFKWIVGVHHNLLSLKAWTKTELQLKPWTDKSTTQTEQTVLGIWTVRKIPLCLHPVKMSQLLCVSISLKRFTSCSNHYCYPLTRQSHIPHTDTDTHTQSH